MSAVSNEGSLKKRYAYKLVANSINLSINLVIHTIVPRVLGPVLYGNFSFLTDFFIKVTGFFDCSSSSAFFTKLSQRPAEGKLLKFYLYYAFILALMTFILTGLCLSVGLKNSIWPTQDTGLILAAAVWGVLTWFSQILNQTLDALGLTKKAEMIKIIQRVFAMFLIVALAWAKFLGLIELFFYHYIILTALILTWWRLILNQRSDLFSTWSLNRSEIRSYFQEFLDYCKPLINYMIIGMLTGIAERWILQKYSGSVEQGYYGLAYQISTICFVFASGMTPLLWREFSKAFWQKDLQRARWLYEYYIPLMGALITFLSVFVAAEARTVSWLAGGEHFVQASQVIFIMGFFAIHQTYGQLSASVFFANGDTRLYRNIGNSFCILGVIVTYFLIAPQGAYGLGLGAVGLALKMVLLNIVQVNFQIWYGTRFLKLKFYRFLLQQIFAIGSLFLMAKTVVYLVSLLKYSQMISFFMSGFFYILAVIWIFSLFPSLLFLNGKGVRNLILAQIARLLKK